MRRQWYRPRSIARSIAIRPKVYWAALAAAVVLFALPGSVSGNIRTAMAGDVGALIYLVLSLKIMRASGAETMRKRSALQDDSAIVILVVILIAIALGFYTILGVLAEAKAETGATKTLHILLAAVTVLLSWLVTQVVFTFHYAHEFYRPDGGGGRGLVFPEEEHPDYWDFLYFATSLGAASQTSDVAITGRWLRRLVTLHAIISFLFNTAVLALAINIGASLL
ncbi:MAG TPA: DUF1345 domain-containing protein [Hyphomicrobiaceae bacterium]|nr:DUF1345 domain-containing protein [Hyphomicrobiaceae bacterium]